MSIDCLRLNCSFLSAPKTLCSRSRLFDLLNLLQPGIPISIGDISYLYVLSVEHKQSQIYSGKVLCKKIHLNNTPCVGEIYIVTKRIYTRKLFDKLSDQL